MDERDERGWPHARADDGGRTRDLKLGKLALCQLSYVRLATRLYEPAPCRGDSIETELVAPYNREILALPEDDGFGITAYEG